MIIYTLTQAEPAYPRGLLDLADPPDIRVRGSLNPGPVVAIVGTRDPTDEARAYARELAASLASKGVQVWSGGALGIDTAAHEGALDVAGATVVVLGGGIDRPYPIPNHALFERVIERGGALVSCFADDAPAMTPRFFTRNRLLAAAADLVIVVECELKSGARNAASHARRLRKALAVVMQPPWTRRGLGCYEEVVKYGATPLRDAEHALDLTREAYGLRWAEVEPGRPGTLAEARDPLELAIVRAVEHGARDVDGICDAIRAPTASVVAALFELVLRGEVRETHRGLRVSSGTESGKTLASHE